MEKLFEEIMVENYPNLRKEIDIQPQEAQRVRNKINPKRPTLRHITIKKPKFRYKERILKTAREKQLITYKGASKHWQPISHKKICRTEELGIKYLMQ